MLTLGLIYFRFSMNSFDSDDDSIAKAMHKPTARQISDDDDSSISKISFQAVTNEKHDDSSSGCDSDSRSQPAKKSRGDDEEIDFNADPGLWGLRRSGRGFRERSQVS
jgi:hypothetical protein